VLFDKVMVVTRTATRNNKLSYQIVKDPIPLSELELIDLSETENKKGSFKSKVLRHTSHGKSLESRFHSHIFFILLLFGYYRNVKSIVLLPIYF